MATTGKHGKLLHMYAMPAIHRAAMRRVEAMLWIRLTANRHGLSQRAGKVALLDQPRASACPP